MDKEEKQRFYGSMLFPAFMVLVMWLIKLIESGFNISFADYGLQPQTFTGLRGILFSPLLHANWAHLSANTVPFFVLTAGLFYYYQKKAFTIFILSWLVTGLWVWIFAKDTGIHIGASGVVYALATFHFTSGILRREPRMMAFSMLVVFLYGGLVWGVIPDFFPDKNISWQSHLLGGVAGILLAFAYRDEGPQRKDYQWDDDDDDDDDTEYPETEIPGSDEELGKTILPGQDAALQSKENTTSQSKVNYIFKERKP
jgi:membrane associated rhomboid family serine protease